jgi:hypothetical protein
MKPHEIYPECYEYFRDIFFYGVQDWVKQFNKVTSYKLSCCRSIYKKMVFENNIILSYNEQKAKNKEYEKLGEYYLMTHYRIIITSPTKRNIGITSPTQNIVQEEVFSFDLSDEVPVYNIRSREIIDYFDMKLIMADTDEERILMMDEYIILDMFSHYCNNELENNIQNIDNALIPILSKEYVEAAKNYSLYNKFKLINL